MKCSTNFNGNVLKDLIKGRGMTYSSFADEFLVNPLTVRNWIRRGQKPSSYNLERLALFFDVSEEIFTESEKITKDNATKIAEETHTIFMAFQSAGFSPEQAMQLTVASLQSN